MDKGDEQESRDHRELQFIFPSGADGVVEENGEKGDVETPLPVDCRKHHEDSRKQGEESAAQSGLEDMEQRTCD